MVGVDSYVTPDAEALLRTGEAQAQRELHRRRELMAHGVGAVSLLTAAALLAALAPWHLALSVPTMTLLVALYVAAQQVKFPVSSLWTAPVMLVFVPMLFLLPTPLVPLIVIAANLISRLPDLRRRPGKIAWTAVFIGDTWFALGPALVIVLGGAQAFAWSKWPIYILAVVAQVIFDMGATIGRDFVSDGTEPGVLRLLAWTYGVDVSLWSLGTLIAAAAIGRPGLVLLALSPMAMMLLFARERQRRLDAILELSTAYRGTSLLLGDIIEADDSYTGMHSRDVVDLSLDVADALGLDATRKRDVEFAALLHDVGKVRVPKEILNKPGALDPDELEIVRRHPTDGEQMLKQVGGVLAHVARIVRYSHERYDGEGYPDGLAGRAIPIESRIISACDAFSAMTTTRSYRAAMPTPRAVDELRRSAGTQFDPAVVEALVAIITPARSPAEHPPLAASNGRAAMPTSIHIQRELPPEFSPRSAPAIASLQAQT